MGVSMIVLTAAVNLAISAATVKTVSGPYVAAGVWTGVILASISVIGFYVKIMPKLREINVTARRDEMLQMGMRIEALEKQVKDANEKIIAANNSARSSESKYTTLAAAVELMLGELEHIDPSNHIIKQVRNLVTLAASADQGVGDGLLHLMKVKGVGE
jgi:hypothetical protein